MTPAEKQKAYRHRQRAIKIINALIKTEQEVKALLKLLKKGLK